TRGRFVGRLLRARRCGLPASDAGDRNEATAESPGRWRRSAQPEPTNRVAEAFIAVVILAGVCCVCAAGVQNARPIHSNPPFLPTWVLSFLDRNGDGILNIFDDPLSLAAEVVVPLGTASLAATAVWLARAFFAHRTAHRAGRSQSWAPRKIT